MFSLTMNTWFGKCVFKLLIREVDNYPKKTRRNSEKFVTCQRLILNPVKHLRWSFSRKLLTAYTPLSVPVSLSVVLQVISITKKNFILQ